jgi:hypothetical protein
MSNQPTDAASKASSNSLNRQISLYSLAAAAAGVSILALAQPARSEVVITKKTIPIPANQGQFGLGIDLNHDGVNDFYFEFRSATLQPPSRTLNVTAVQGELIGISSYELNNVYAYALKRGAKIGPSAQFSFVPDVRVERSYPIGASSEKLLGKWGGNPKNRYLGVRFLIKGEYHYGWIRLTVHTRPMSATITAYAYETVPNQGISAGAAEIETVEIQGSKSNQNQVGPSLGMLAAGAEGLPLWRRE